MLFRAIWRAIIYIITYFFEEFNAFSVFNFDGKACLSLAIKGQVWYNVVTNVPIMPGGIDTAEVGCAKTQLEREGRKYASNHSGGRNGSPS